MRGRFICRHKLQGMSTRVLDYTEDLIDGRGRRFTRLHYHCYLCGNVWFEDQYW